MRTHGWGGTPPASDDEARRRILDATLACLDEQGTSVGIADVARRLGVTRPTVYRYYAGTEDLLLAAVVDTTQGLMDRVWDGFPELTAPDQIVVEAVSRMLEQLPEERYLWLMLTGGRALLFARGVSSPMSMGLGESIVARMPVDWNALGISDEVLTELTELIMRMIQSFMLDPGSPRRCPDDIRAFLSRWLAPSVRAAL
ncbi:TetR/AcrR family transcriptional regulator [soil metagenome]